MTILYARDNGNDPAIRFFMSAKDEKRENQDLKARPAALSKKSAAEPASPAVTPLPEKEPKYIKPKSALDSHGRKSSSKSLCHYMYVSPDEDLFFKRLIGKFIVATGETLGASEALRVMMFAAAEASDDQLREAYQRARAGDGKRMTEK
jgi:hypothetical protein